MPLTVEYCWKCSICGEIKTDKFPTWDGCEIPKPHLPANWVCICRDMHVCEKHEVLVRTDALDGGKVLIEWPRVKEEG